MVKVMELKDYTWHAGDDEIEGIAKDQRFKDLISEFLNRNIIKFSNEEGEPLVKLEFSIEDQEVTIEVVGPPSGPNSHIKYSVSLISLFDEWVEMYHGLSPSGDDYKNEANAISRHMGAIADRMYEHDSLYLDFSSRPLESQNLSYALIAAHKMLRGGGPKEDIFDDLKTRLMAADDEIEMLKSKIEKLNDN